MNLKKINQEITARLAHYPQHNRHLLEIKESKIPGAGLGLFAKHDIPKGTVVDLYYGKRLSKEEYEQMELHDTLYIMEIDENTYVDGSVVKNFISFCNDARGLNRVPGIRNNSKFELSEDENEMALITTRNIKQGEEIFVFYGTSYWNAAKYLHEQV